MADTQSLVRTGRRRCALCQYDLAGLPKKGEPILRCPECGQVNVVEFDPPADEPMPAWWVIAGRLSAPTACYAALLVVVDRLLHTLPPHLLLLGIWMVVVAIVRGVNLAARCSTFKQRTRATTYVVIIGFAANVVVLWAALFIAERVR